MIKLCLWFKKKEDSMGFRAVNRLRVNKVQTAGCFFCAAFTSSYEGNDRGHTITTTTEKATKLINDSHQKTQEYIKNI